VQEACRSAKEFGKRKQAQEMAQEQGPERLSVINERSAERIGRYEEHAHWGMDHVGE